MTANGRHARWYIAGERGDPQRFFLPVTYHKPVRGRTRQLTVGTKLLSKALTQQADVSAA